jgi:hypothetical protein
MRQAEQGQPRPATTHELMIRTTKDHGAGDWQPLGPSPGNLRRWPGPCVTRLGSTHRMGVQIMGAMSTGSVSAAEPVLRPVAGSDVPAQTSRCSASEIRVFLVLSRLPVGAESL